MWMVKKDKEGQCHPAEQSDFESENGQSIGFDRRNQSLFHRETTHWLDREVLKGDSKEPSESAPSLL